jgi:hypothetical protein
MPVLVGIFTPQMLQVAARRTSQHNELDRRQQLPPMPDMAKHFGYAASLRSTIGRYFDQEELVPGGCAMASQAVRVALCRHSIALYYQGKSTVPVLVLWRSFSFREASTK